MRQRLLPSLHGLVRIAQLPQDPGRHSVELTAGSDSIQAGVRSCMQPGIAESNPPLMVGAGKGKEAHISAGDPQRMVGPLEQGGVVLLLGHDRGVAPPRFAPPGALSAH